MGGDPARGFQERAVQWFGRHPSKHVHVARVVFDQSLRLLDVDEPGAQVEVLDLADLVHRVVEIDRQVSQIVLGSEGRFLGWKAITVRGSAVLAQLAQVLGELQVHQRLAVLQQLVQLGLASREELPPGDLVLAVVVLEQVRQEPPSGFLGAAPGRVLGHVAGQVVEDLLDLFAPLLG